jgi:hypothetical protein
MARAFQWTSQELQDMVSSYTQGESAQSIAKRYGTSYQVIQPVLVKQGITLRSLRQANKRQTCNDRFFQVIDSEEKAYWLGFLAADGCVTQGKKSGDSPRVTLNLAKRDHGHVVKLKQALQASQMVSESERSCSLTITSAEMVLDLAMHGIVPRKTFSTKPAQVAPELARHYWRGVFDGDGHISKRHEIYLVGDCDMLLGFQTFVFSHCLKARGNILRMENIYRFGTKGNTCLAMLHLMYAEATVYLDRKYELAQAVLREM